MGTYIDYNKIYCATKNPFNSYTTTSRPKYFRYTNRRAVGSEHLHAPSEIRKHSIRLQNSEPQALNAKLKSLSTQTLSQRVQVIV